MSAIQDCQLVRAPGAPALPATPLRFILHFVAQAPWRYTIMVLLETANACCGIMVPYALNRVISSIAENQRIADVVSTLRIPLLLFVAFTIGEVVFGRLAAGLQFRLAPRQRAKVMRSLFHYLQHHSRRFMGDNFAGALASRISEAAMGVNQTLWTAISEFWPTTIIICVSVGLLFDANFKLGAFALGWAITFVAASFLLARRCQAYSIDAAAARSVTTGKVVDSVSNHTSARLFARLGFERALLENELAREVRTTLRANRYSEVVRWFQFAGAAVLKLGVLFLALLGLSEGLISLGQFVMAVSLTLLVINEARNLSRRFLEFFEYVGNIANCVRTIVRSHELIDGPEASPKTITGGRIEFQQVTFHYLQGRPIFTRLSVAIEAGQRVGLVGVSGSGKSTFLNLVLRLYDPQSGQILIDGRDLRKMTMDCLHEQIALIPQDSALFHRTLRENIRYGRPDASDAEVEEAARRAHAHEFITRIPGGYDALVGERGLKLSGGQRQRIAIARVILKNAPVLILDEATSSLDSLTERAIEDTLTQEMKGKTVIVVAHRLSTVAHLDRILVFDDGRITEDGPPAQLLANRGAYYRLWARLAEGSALGDGESPTGRALSLGAHPGNGAAS